MRWLLGCIAMLTFSGPLLAQDVIASPPKTGSPFWDVIGYLLGIILVPVMSLAVKLIYEWQAKLAAEKGEADLSFKEKLKHEAQVALARIAENIANKQLRDMKEAAKDGKVDKDELKRLGREAIQQAKVEFKTQGIDLGKRLGEEYLESELRNIVDKMKTK